MGHGNSIGVLSGAVTVMIGQLERRPKDPALAPKAGVAAPPPTRPVGLGSHLWHAAPSLGPAFVVAIAYVDPGNFVTDFQAGQLCGYSLIWVVVMANLLAMFVQYLSAKVGIVSGASLPELCRLRFTVRTNRLLWVQAQVMAVATDLAAFIGSAIGLNLLFGISLPVAGVVAALVVLAILQLDRRGHRRFETGVTILLGLIIAGMLVETLHVGPSLHQSVNGLIPRLTGNSSIVLSAGIVGATVMPHAIYAHSALSASGAGRKDDSSTSIRIRGARLDVTLALGIAGVVNVAMVAMAARLFPSFAPASGGATLAGIQEGFLVKAGGLSALIFSIALLLSGVAASTVGSFAGQVIADGFLQMRSPFLVRRLATVIPAVALLASGVNSTEALVLSQVVLSFGILPAVIPLVMLTRSKTIMGKHASRPLERALGVGTVIAIFGLNAYLIANSLGS